MLCAKLGWQEAVELLVAHQAKLNLTDAKGRNVSLLAALANQFEMVKSLEQMGASCQVTDKEGNSALSVMMSRPTLDPALSQWVL